MGLTSRAKNHHFAFNSSHIFQQQLDYSIAFAWKTFLLDLCGFCFVVVFNKATGAIFQVKSQAIRILFSVYGSIPGTKGRFFQIGGVFGAGRND